MANKSPDIRQKVVFRLGPVKIKLQNPWRLSRNEAVLRSKISLCYQAKTKIST